MKTIIVSLFILISPFSISQVNELWGSNALDGPLGGGLIYKLDTAGNNFQPVFQFDDDQAAMHPMGNMVEAPNGRFYGTTNFGGISNNGCIFEYYPSTGMLIKLIQFPDNDFGQNPKSDLIIADNGRLYGTTSAGGVGNKGVVFEYDITTKIYTKLVDFDGAAKGSYPIGKLCQASDGFLYGLTPTGGLNDHGVIYKIDPSNGQYTKLYDLNGPLTGRDPRGGFFEASNGNLFTTTRYGGSLDNGTILELNLSTGLLTKEFDFTGGTSTGYRPEGGLTEADNGLLYGLNTGVGAISWVYSYNFADSTYTKIVQLTETSHGYNPYGAFLKHSNGLLYATCSDGGINGTGTIIRFNTLTNTLTKLHDFILSGDIAPTPNLFMGSDGKIYGTTREYPTSQGVMFEFNVLTSTYSVIYGFGQLPNAKSPCGKFILHTDNFIYGVCSGGGVNDMGAIFRYLPETDLYEELHYFSGADGSTPLRGMVDGGNGKFYGTTNEGGAFDFGVLFEFDPTTADYTKLFDFNSVDGNSPQCELLLADNGLLYGTAPFGGVSNNGTLFQFDVGSNAFTKLHDFTSSTTGAGPKGKLLQASNGKLYGITAGGGFYSDGTLFEYDILTNIFTTKINFLSSVQGSSPESPLVEASDGKIYGTTHFGGGANGTLFQYDYTTNSIEVKATFDAATDGQGTEISLTQSSNGKLYGQTNNYGPNAAGTIYEYDLLTENLTTKLILDDGITGRVSRSALSEFYFCFPQYNLNEYLVICPGTDFTAPDGTLYTNVIADFSHTSFFQTIEGCDSTITSLISVVTNDTSVVKNLTTLTSNATLGLFQWLDCDNAYAEIPGAVFSSYVAPTTGNFAVKLNNAGCPDTSSCYTITVQDFYDLPGYTNLDGEVFAFPVTTIPVCDGIAHGIPFGGIPPYSFDWFTQTYNDYDIVNDSICEGFHTLKIKDNIGDSVLVDYYVTDSANFYNWYLSTFVGYVDTLYIAAPNCLLDYSLPIDGMAITDSYFLMPDTIPLFDLYFIELTYYQSGVAYIHQDTVSLSTDGWYLISFTVYCPIKSSNSIKTMLFAPNYPLFLGSISQSINNEINIFPNPFCSIIHMDGLLPNQLIRIFAADGRLVFETKTDSTSVELNLEHLSRGTYLIDFGHSSVTVIKT